jgi:hypothetical protein
VKAPHPEERPLGRVSKDEVTPLLAMPYRFFPFGGFAFGGAGGRFGCSAGRFGNPP